ncbi:MAG TPA: hypothetical protein VGR53_01360 [Nitrososphaerales archaeon]|nr:hypothetical protein [Nitrososphaerales archaeon]
MSGQVQREEVEEVLLLPWNAVDAAATRDEYRRKSRFFLEFGGFVNPKLMHHTKGPNSLAVKLEREEIERGMKVFIKRSQEDPKFARSVIVRFLERERGRIDRKEVTPNHLRNCFKPIRLALEMNDIPMSWKNIMRMLPKPHKKGKDREYSLMEIQALIGAASLPMKVAILFMVSSGIRVGAFQYLNVGHVKPLEVAGKIAGGRMLVYVGEGDDEYETLISREAYQTFQDYLAIRRARGEKVIESSPMIMTRNGTKRCSVGTIMNTMNDLLRRSGVRVGTKKRYEVQANHGLRKFFDNVAKDYVDEAYVEKLIGHYTGTKEAYDRHLPKPAVEQYLRAMPHLSISPAYRAEAELTKKLDEMKQIEDKGFTELRLQLLEKDSAVRKLEARMEQQVSEDDKLREDLKRLSKRVAHSDSQSKAAYAAFRGDMALASAYAGALQKVRKILGEKRVDELLSSAIMERDERDRKVEPDPKRRG